MRDLNRSRAALDDLLTEFEGDGRVRSLAAVALAPVLSYDTEHNGDLAHTLRVYFRNNGNASQAASRLFLHRNGLLYRLLRVEQLLGVTLNDPAVRLRLELAIHLLETSDAEEDRSQPASGRVT